MTYHNHNAIRLLRKAGFSQPNQILKVFYKVFITQTDLLTVETFNAHHIQVNQTQFYNIIADLHEQGFIGFKYFGGHNYAIGYGAKLWPYYAQQVLSSKKGRK